MILVKMLRKIMQWEGECLLPPVLAHAWVKEGVCVYADDTKKSEDKSKDPTDEKSSSSKTTTRLKRGDESYRKKKSGIGAGGYGSAKEINDGEGK